jgi:hypothetical protein
MSKLDARKKELSENFTKLKDTKDEIRKLVMAKEITIKQFKELIVWAEKYYKGQ